ncbi:MAG: DUF456 domain-containing protein [Bacteroidaceae bacterium]|jgi:uncharacterized protein YqgC (DUF456 family)|nr:DUF456 domain-containing protein [Bacteroidaceae bacterium]
MWDFVIVLFAWISAIVGVIGAIVPAVPGPPISFVGFLLLSFCDNNEVGVVTLIITGLLAVIITVVDYIAPVWFTKKAGGSKAGMWGSTIGLVIGLFTGLWGIIIGPFLGAFIGELIVKTEPAKALEVAFMSFIAFLLTTGMKLVYCVVLLVMIFTESWTIIWG